MTLKLNETDVCALAVGDRVVLDGRLAQLEERKGYDFTFSYVYAFGPTHTYSIVELVRGNLFRRLADYEQPAPPPCYRPLWWSILMVAAGAAITQLITHLF